MQSTPRGTHWATAERSVAVSAPGVRTEVLAGLRAAGWKVEVEQLTRLEAVRGSAMTGLTLQPERLPLAISVRIDEGPAATTISLHLRDRLPKGLAPKTVESAYRTAFEGALGALDSLFARLDPAAAFAEPHFSGAAGAPPPALMANAARLLDRRGARTQAEQPMTIVRSPKGVAAFDAPAIQAMATVGLMIVAQPGAMPERLAAQVSQFVAIVERAEGQIEIGADLVPVVEFLRQQARLRESMPLRTLETCTACRHEKVTNPDLKRLQDRNRKVKAISGGVGAFISPYGVSPFILAGRLVDLKQLDPDFVCPRCQGMTADSSLITFCTACGDRRDERVLRTCGKCGHDLRTDLPEEPLWREIEAGGPVPAAAPKAFSEAGPKALPTAAPPPPTATPSGWFADPAGSGRLRWWDGSAWTDHLH